MFDLDARGLPIELTISRISRSLKNVSTSVNVSKSFQRQRVSPSMAAFFPPPKVFLGIWTIFERGLSILCANIFEKFGRFPSEFFVRRFDERVVFEAKNSLVNALSSPFFL